MARIEIDVDDALLGEAAHDLGPQGAEDTVRAALAAAVSGTSGVPRRPAPPGEPLPGSLPPAPGPPGSPPPAPGRPGYLSPEFPRPPEIH
ncbi:MAG: hypothetical protein L0I24_10030 [Pseudonocardia sp.]|nr:hypothetical protein [Pseudonocardia sp.]